MLKHSTSTLALAVLTAGLASAQGDECATATAAALGMTPFDTTTATLSPEFWPCAAAAAPDIWFTYTAANTNDLRIELCGSTYDTALEILTGACGAQTSVICNDDACGLQSGVTLTGVNTGDVYYIRIGGFTTNTGTGTMSIAEQVPPPPPPPNCVESLYGWNNFGNPGGAIYFDLTVTQSTTISGLECNTSAAIPAITMYTTPGTFAGNETNMAAWTQVAEDDGLGIGAGLDLPSAVNFVAPFVLAPGTYGICLVGDNFTTGSQQEHRYTNGTGGNQNFVSGDGNLTLNLGTASNFPFAAPIFTPRVWNGRICASGPIVPGTNYCGPATPNSTGVPGTMSASGTNSIANNDLVLEAHDLPLSATAFFLTSMTQGLVMNPGGSQGDLCLGGAIGRYVGPGQVQNSGGNGSVSLAVDNSMHPTPTGLVQIMAGETWNYQCWHRDAVGGMAVSNFTDGYSITHN